MKILLDLMRSLQVWWIFAKSGYIDFRFPSYLKGMLLEWVEFARFDGIHGRVRLLKFWRRPITRPINIGF